VTLAEVLVSLGIMSLGVVTLATLFPLSVLRTVQATQLTGAVLHRYNAEATVRAIPDLVHDPDGDDDSSTLPSGPNYVVDPMGFATYGSEGQVADHTQFGFSDDMGTDAGLDVERFGYIATTADVLAATEFVTSPDSWTQILEADADAFTPDLAASPNQTIAFTADLSAVNAGDRVVLFHDNGRASEVRTIDGVSGGTVTLEDLPLPAGYTAATIATARIETQDLRYSWLLTVRNSTGVAHVNVAVFFNRGVGIEDEIAYTNGAGTVFNAGSATATINYGGSLPEPNVKAGGFVLDAENLYWYRVARVDSSGTVLTIELVETAKADSNAAVVLPQIIDVYPIGSFAP
jgi:hypothetical protein